MTTVSLLLQPPYLQIIAAVLGCLVGSLAMDPIKRYGLRIAILFTILSSVAAGAVSEYLVAVKDMRYVLIHALIGIGFGLLGQFLIEEIKESAPTFFKSLIKILTSTIMDNIADTLMLFFDGIRRKLKRWFPK